ncbi:MAG: hypothetical protein J6Y28_09690 [Acholeplasmatales bacterium]|nr:hypothetical protein [Methanobrevibacter sp.]MBP5446430.1 hypothetical protein [Acholeplasmatales bacterium]
MSTNLQQIEPEYIYVTIPAEYICVYHRILAMLADYGEDMLKDCKASCKDRNVNVIECFNMFNAAVAARKLSKDKLAETLIKYIKAKINQIYKGHDNSTSFVFPIDENGQIKAFVSCGERPRFEINPDDGALYEHKFNNGFDEHFKLGPEDESTDGEDVTPPVEEIGLVIDFTPEYHLVDGEYKPCGDLVVRYNGEYIDPNTCIIQYYFDDIVVLRFNDVTGLTTGTHNFKVVVTYNNETKIVNKDLYYAAIS